MWSHIRIYEYYAYFLYFNWKKKKGNHKFKLEKICLSNIVILTSRTKWIWDTLISSILAKEFGSSLDGEGILVISKVEDEEDNKDTEKGDDVEDGCIWTTSDILDFADANWFFDRNNFESRPIQPLITKSV